MATKDIFSNQLPVNFLPPASYTSTQDPAAGVDLKGFEGCAFVVCTGAVTDGTWTMSLEDSDDNVSFSAVNASMVQGSASFTGANDNAVYQMGYLGRKRYVKAKMTLAATGTAIFGISCIKGAPHSAPTA
jgi:hypothetical protein